MGMIATGKSYLARALAKRLGCSYYNSDVIRKELAQVEKGETRDTAIGQGIYSPGLSQITYLELLARAEADLEGSGGRCVVLDASYQSSIERGKVLRRLKNEYELFFIHCTAPESTMRLRMEKRKMDPTAISDGCLEVYLEQKKRFEYPVELDEKHLLTLDTNKPLVTLLQCVERFLRQ